MSEPATGPSLLRLALYAIGIAVIVGLSIRYVHHRHSAGVSLQEQPPSAVPAPEAPRPAPAPGPRGRAEILAGCHPHLAADQEAELDFVQHLTFTVPGTQECQTRPLEMIGNFSESRESGGEWATVLEVHPLYAFEGDQVAVRP
jgi:hypothetical protein